ncbi:MAG: hypothetical protein OEU90_01510 [Gammaproteobacteria bacterium]|nr:hypothetical protein [Gammaproteobacteria bacterium]MDH3751646.1 hypothetical protein [Gammaproteobacteria bacterium]MDH3804125.1 hypothetical protein [Gammaproteobacteria bacterium]
MKPNLATIALLAAGLAGCISHDGTYAPSCIAYAGSNITLNDGEFVWEKFTDEVVVNDDGEIVDQFPGYPMRGAYRIDGQIVLMTSAEGESMDNMYLHRHDNHTYLYTARQFEERKSSGKNAECALMLAGDSDEK